VPPARRAVKSGGLSHWAPTETLLIEMLGCSFWNASTSAFQSRSSSFCAPTGWQSTVMVTLSPAALDESSFVEQAARLNPNPAATASAATLRYCVTDIYPSLRGTGCR
jgi:hypothetical protein